MMLYIITAPIKSKKTQKVYLPGEFLFLREEKATILLNEGVIRPAVPEEVLELAIYNRGKYPVSYLDFAYYCAFKHDKRPSAPSHLLELITRLEREVKIALDKHFYTYVIESLELVYHIIFNNKAELVDISTQRYIDLIDGFCNLCVVLKQFSIINRTFKKNDFVSPRKKIYFQLIREGYIRPVYPAEGLEYLINHNDYPEFWLVYGVNYAFAYPVYPELPEDVVNRVKKLFRAYEHCYDKRKYTQCRILLAKAKCLVWDRHGVT